ncbi:MAG TPA: TIM-barrel domain-containing protein, partial [Pseudomonadales bacterium]|nr:TIM-barrel domain-containing protein [Pseudomonadales bacterium]
MIAPNCIRLEYSSKGHFVDAPTLFAMHRETGFFGAKITNEANTVTIDTGEMHLEFRPDGQPFSRTNLTIIFQMNGTNVNWWPGQINAHNLGGAATTLDGVAKPFPLPDGLLARDGWYLLDDSGSAILTNGWIAQRPYVLPPVRRPSNKPPPPSDIDWYFFAYGTDFRWALKTLGAISGPAAMPRKEVLGSWYCRWYPYTADEFRQIVNEYSEHDFPLDILVMDMDWHTQDARTGYGHAGNLGWTGYTWNRKLIPDPEKLLNEFKDDGLFITLNDHPADGIRDHEDSYAEFMKLLPSGTPANPPFDAGNSNYMNAFFEASHVPLEREGVDFWWLDWQQDYIYPYVYGVPGLRHLPWLNYLYFEHSQQNGKRGQ